MNSHAAEQARKRAKTLVDLHADKHGLLAAECSELQDKSKRFSRFYKELNGINAYHANRAAEKMAMVGTVGLEETGQDPDPFSELEIPASGRELVDFSGDDH